MRARGGDVESADLARDGGSVLAVSRALAAGARGGSAFVRLKQAGKICREASHLPPPYGTPSPRTAALPASSLQSEPSPHSVPPGSPAACRPSHAGSPLALAASPVAPAASGRSFADSPAAPVASGRSSVDLRLYWQIVPMYCPRQKDPPTLLPPTPRTRFASPFSSRPLSLPHRSAGCIDARLRRRAAQNFAQTLARVPFGIATCHTA